MITKELIYSRAPYFFKYILFNCAAFVNFIRRFSGNFKIYLSEYENNLLLSKDELELYQENKIKELLLECLSHSDWYKSKMKSSRISKSEIISNPIIALKKLPILLKEERKQFVEEIVNQNPKFKTIEVGYTSGTSGAPTKNYLDLQSIRRSMAIWKRYHKSLGIKRSDRQIRFSGNKIINIETTLPPFWIYNFFENQILFSTYHLNENNSRHYINKMNQFKPKLLDGYPSGIHELAKFILKSNIKLSFTPKAIVVTAETLYANQREDIERAFNCKVFNQYASSEGSPFITECLHGKLHVNTDTGFFEFLTTDNKVAKPGEIAKMVVTSFRNNKTPLLRYDIEDCVLLSKETIKCACGSVMPVIEKIIGREDDLLVSVNGTLIGMMAYRVFKYAKNITKGQIIQKSKLHVIINVEVTPDFRTQDDEFLKEKIKEALGKEVFTEVKLTEKIPFSANGKFRPIIREFSLN